MQTNVALSAFTDVYLHVNSIRLCTFSFSANLRYQKKQISFPVHAGDVISQSGLSDYNMDIELLMPM